jgi:signal transduction histidine kinase
MKVWKSPQERVHTSIRVTPALVSEAPRAYRGAPVPSSDIVESRSAAKDVRTPPKELDDLCRSAQFGYHPTGNSFSPLRQAAGASISSASLRDMTKEKWAEQELQRYAEGLRTVSRRLVEVEATERRWLANELHNLVGQKLTALNIHLNIVKNESAPSMDPQMGARLDDSLKLVEETIECIRDVMTELRPAVLDDYGLTPVLRWYAEQYVKRTGVHTTVIEQGPTRRLPANAEEALFRIAQEALANVAKYARAENATVTFSSTPQTSSLTIADDGRGFDPLACHPPARDHGWGLMIMRERAAAVGADLTIESAPGSGTSVIVTLTDEAA